MSVESKIKILSRHPYLRLHLAHAAIGTYPCHNTANRMTVNRVIVVLSDSGDEHSAIRDSVSGEFFPMRPGHLYFVPCSHPSDWDFSPKLHFVSLQFNLELFYGFDAFRNYPKCISKEAGELAAELKELIQRDEELRTLCRLNEILFHLCVELLEQHPESTSPGDGEWHVYEKVLNYIRTSGNATTTVESLAGMMNLQSSAFSRKFTRDIGISPKDFLLNTLIRKASEMLLVPGATVKETAGQLQFSSEYYFSGFFKRQTGISPTEFQRTQGMRA